MSEMAGRLRELLGRPGMVVMSQFFVCHSERSEESRTTNDG